MERKSLIILLFVLFLCFPPSIFAETIILKSGKKIEGKIIEKTDKYIKIDFEGVPLTYNLDEVANITGQSAMKSTLYPKKQEETGVAEMHSQNNGLFKINLPKGWDWKETSEQVIITNPQRNNGIIIKFVPKSVDSDEAKKIALEESSRALISFVIKPLKGEINSEKEILVDGIYAKRLDYILPIGGKAMQETAIYFLNKGYAFAISFGSDSKDEGLKLDRIVKTFRF